MAVPNFMVKYSNQKYKCGPQSDARRSGEKFNKVTHKILIRFQNIPKNSPHNLSIGPQYRCRWLEILSINKHLVILNMPYRHRAISTTTVKPRATPSLLLP